MKFSIELITMTSMLPVIFVLLVPVTKGVAQPITWTFAARRTSSTEATIFFNASLGRGWHLYSQALPEGGPVKTCFTFVPSGSFELIGTVSEPKPLIKHEKYFDMNVGYFKKDVTFKQQIKLNDKRAEVNGVVQFMVCSDRQCLPPQNVGFLISVN